MLYIVSSYLFALAREFESTPVRSCQLLSSSPVYSGSLPVAAPCATNTVITDPTRTVEAYAYRLLMASLSQQAHRVAYIQEESSISSRRKPQITRVSRSETLPTIIEDLETDGVVIIKDFTSPEAVDRSMHEVRPWLDKQSDGKRVGGKSHHHLRRTRPVLRLIQGWRVGRQLRRKSS